MEKTAVAPRSSGPDARRRPRASRGSGEALRADVIEAAGALLAETGDASLLSLRAIARRVGIATTSIYLHFEDLKAVLLEVKRVRFLEFGDILQAAADEAGDDPIRRIEALGHAYVRFGMSNPGHYRVLFSTQVEVALTAPAGPMLGGRAFEIVTNDISRFLTQRGEPVNPDEILMLGTHLWTGVHGMVSLRSALTLFPWPDVGAEIADLVDRVMLGRVRERN